MFSDKKVSELLHTDIDCKCGCHHTITAPELCLSEEITEVVKSIIPAGQVLVIISEDITDGSCRALAAAGFSVTEYLVPPYNTPDISEAEELAKKDESVRLILGIGGTAAIEMSKRVALLKNVPLLCMPCNADFESCFKAECALREGDRYVKFPGKFPDRLVYNKLQLINMPEEHIAAGYGRMLGFLVRLIDYSCMKLAGGERFCRYLSEAVLKDVDIQLKRRGYEAQVHLHGCLLRLSIYFTLMEFHTGADIQLSDTIERYLHFKKGDKRLYGENQFLSAAMLGTVYESYLRNEIITVVPPDRLQSVDKMCRMLNIKEKDALKNARPLDANRKIEYRLKLFRDELYAEACKCNELIKEGIRQIKRIYTDSADYLRYYMHREDLKELLSIASEYVPAPTLLTIIKDQGII